MSLGKRISYLNSIREIVDDYDYFILDVWGVIHDGRELYPNVIESLSFLRNLNKKICFLSNAPRRSKLLEKQFQELGIDKNFYDFILTSGESAHSYLLNNQISGYLHFGPKFFYIGPERDFGLLEGLNYCQVKSISEANFILLTGFDNDESKVEEKLHLIKEAKEYELEIICTNPDLRVVRKCGKEAICAGALAVKYQEIEGKVYYFGKPYPAVFDELFLRFSNPNKNRTLVIGDGIETDILGASNYGLDSVLVLGGIYSKNIKNYDSSTPDLEDLEPFLQSHNAFPKFIISNLKI